MRVKCETKADFMKRDFSFCGAFIADIFSFFVGSMFKILRGHLYKPLRGRVELLGEHCKQSQQSRMELGLRVSRGLSRASCDQRGQVEWEMVLARHFNPVLRSFASFHRSCVGHLGQPNAWLSLNFSYSLFRRRF